MKRAMAMVAAMVAGCLLAAAQQADYTALEKAVAGFSATWDVGVGREVFVVGGHEDLGAWNPVRARKLRWTEGNVWTGALAVASGNAIEYKFVARSRAGVAYCDVENVVWWPGANLATNLPLREGAPLAGKTIYYYSSWTNAFLLHRVGTSTNWLDAPMARVGEGRFAGESLYRAQGVGQFGERITFVPHGYADGTEFWDNTPFEGIPDYATFLDAFVLQDGHVYPYWPPAQRTESAIVAHDVASSFKPDAPGRRIQVYLPRNYAANADKRYPVLYMHDGQNVFRSGGAFGSWYAEDAADRMIGLGLMRETIVVAVDNTDQRLTEYLPPGDSTQYGAGTADRYLGFVAHDVKPFVDDTYRTLPDREHTGAMGSSFGGLASLYFGFASNVFGRIGPMSTSFWAIPNFLAARVFGQDTAGLRVYLDCGTEESEEDAFEPMWQVVDKLMADGYVPNDSLRVEVGCGHPHSEWTWAERAPEAFAFLFDAREEANEVLRSEAPPRVSAVAGGGSPSLSFLALAGWNNVLQRSVGLAPAQWTDVATGRVDEAAWAEQALADAAPPDAPALLYRVQSRAW
jgi:predicted alpha/beta superfamily hydrolase